MKLIKKSLAIGAILGLAATSVFAAKGDVLTAAEINTLKSNFPTVIGKPGIKVLKGIDQGEFKQLELEVRTQRGPQQFQVFVVNGTKTLFAGNAYNEKGEKYNLPVNVELIKAGVAFKMGTGPKELYLVTEPECPYCQKLEKNLASDVLEKYTINIIPMPLSFHKKAKPMLNWVFAGANDKEKTDRMHKVLLGDQSYASYKPSAEELAKNEEIFSKGMKAAMELKAGGTPSVFDDKFQKVNYQFLLKK